MEGMQTGGCSLDPHGAHAVQKPQAAVDGLVPRPACSYALEAPGPNPAAPAAPMLHASQGAAAWAPLGLLDLGLGFPSELQQAMRPALSIAA